MICGWSNMIANTRPNDWWACLSCNAENSILWQLHTWTLELKFIATLCGFQNGFGEPDRHCNRIYSHVLIDNLTFMPINVQLYQIAYWFFPFTTIARRLDRNREVIVLARTHLAWLLRPYVSKVIVFVIGSNFGKVKTCQSKYALANNQSNGVSFV